MILTSSDCYPSSVIINQHKNKGFKKVSKLKHERSHNAKILEKQNRAVPSYSDIYRLVGHGRLNNKESSSFRRRLVQEFTPSPRNNGHAKPTVLPKPAFKPQKWPYQHNKVKHTVATDYPTSQDPPHWTYNPPSQDETDSAMITHFQVKPANNHDNTKVSYGLS